MKVHFIGICGSGTSAAACLAKKMGYEVTGCDLQSMGYYSKVLKRNNISIYEGHSISHLDDVDIVVVSDVVKENEPEIIEAKKRNILITWQQFMGLYLQYNKKVICISGTHGKTTTTLLVGVVLTEGMINPIVESGGIYLGWQESCRASESDYFVCEADEYRRHFLNYSPFVLIVNNIEMEHHDYFRDYDDMQHAYSELLRKMHSSKILIVNEECEGVRRFLLNNECYIRDNQIQAIGYYENNKFEDFPFMKEYKGSLIKIEENNLVFEVKSKEEDIQLVSSLRGKHNMFNILGVYALAKELSISDDIFKRAVSNFKGVGRRFELLYNSNNISLYDDYGHHPSEVRSVREMCRMHFPSRRLWIVFEPHSLTRVNALFREFAEELKLFDKISIVKTCRAREPINGPSDIDACIWEKLIGKEKMNYFGDRSEIKDYVIGNIKTGDLVITMGALYDISVNVARALKGN